MLSVYVHIPFCRKKCSYCDFYSIPVGEGRVPHERFCGALLKQFAYDVRRFSLEERGVSSVYFGGGTPSLMPPDFFEKVLWGIGTTLVMQSDIEVSCEVNPGTVDDAWFKRAVDAGINRFSIGVQSFDDDNLNVLGRIHTGEDAQRAIAQAQESGVASLGIDLMFGLPGQKTRNVEGDLKTAMMFQPQHISCYQLTLEKGTALHSVRGHSRLPRSDEVLRQLQLVRRMLSSGGWEPYEISNFARPGYRCRHNLHYWRYGEYLGLGSGAASFVVGGNRHAVTAAYGRRWRMAGDVERYMRGQRIEEDMEKISLRTAMGEYCFLGLRTADGISFDDFERRFGRSFGTVFSDITEKFVARGLLNPAAGRITLTPKGIELSNQVFAEYVE